MKIRLREIGGRGVVSFNWPLEEPELRALKRSWVKKVPLGETQYRFTYRDEGTGLWVTPANEDAEQPERPWVRLRNNGERVFVLDCMVPEDSIGIFQALAIAG